MSPCVVQRSAGAPHACSTGRSNRVLSAGADAPSVVRSRRRLTAVRTLEPALHATSATGAFCEDAVRFSGAQSTVVADGGIDGDAGTARGLEAPGVRSGQR